MFGFIRSIFLSKSFVLYDERVIRAICLRVIGIFDIWSKFAPYFWQKDKNFEPRWTREGKTRSKGVAPRASEKQVAKQTHRSQNISSNWLQNGSPNLKMHCILVILFDVCPHYFWNNFLRIFVFFFNKMIWLKVHRAQGYAF